MTSMLRIFKNKGSVFVVVFICAAIFFLSALLPSSSLPVDDTTIESTHDQPEITFSHAYSRMKDEHKRRLLYSALGHIRTGYVANKTPDIDTPPLLVMYSCKSTEMVCGGLGKRFMDIAHSYYFSMLVDGTAFTVDMTDSINFQTYFEATPGFMALQPSQAYYYLDELEKKNDLIKVRNLTMQTMTLDPNTNYKQQTEQIRILQTTHWPSDSISATFQTSDSMKQLRDQYRLSELPEKSQWFWLANRILLNPTEWLSQQLAPYRLLMGGTIKLGESLSWMDPRNQIDSTVANNWFRIGLRLNHDDTKVDCWRSYVETLCAESRKKQCHVFISATSSHLLNQIKQHPWSVTIHTVPDTLEYTTLEQPLGTKKKNLFESDEQYYKSAYLRPVMDWIILTRMDFLLGSQGDEFIKTAAWAAQVETHFLIDHSCQFKSMVDW